MSDYRLAPDAEDDLTSILRYTLQRWGREQAVRYATLLESALHDIARGDAQYTTPLVDRPEVRCHRCQHHFILYVSRPGDPITILGFLHENMDLPRRLRERLQPR